MSARAALVALLLGASACVASRGPREPVTVADGRYAMGTVLEITLVAGEAATAGELLERLFRVASELDRLLSVHDPASPLSALNRAAGQGPQRLDPRLAGILADSLAYSRATRGAFDPTVGPLVDLWIRAARRDREPSTEELEAALRRVGSSRIRLEGESVELERPGMALDLGAIAKGWALDRMRELLRGEGVRRALVNFGQSSLLALGEPLDAGAWTVALRGAQGRIAGLVHLRDQAFSVSGSLGQWSEIAGRRYGHVIDPRSGRALTDNLQAAVVAPSAALAEAWSTALTVLGREGLALVEAEPGLEAILQDESGARIASSGWDRAVAFEALPRDATPPSPRPR